MNYPTRESVELGLKLAAIDIIESGVDLLDGAMEEAIAVQQNFRPVEKFAALAHGVHETMCHHPTMGGCHFQTQLLYAIMAKMFIAGWSAGRQEVIDDELKRMR